MSLDYKNLGQSGAAVQGLEDYYVAVAFLTTTAAYSTDGITWTLTTMPSSAIWDSVIYGDGKFVAVAYNSNTAAYSTDGITWAQATVEASFALSAVGYGDGKFVALGLAGNTQAAFSTDAISWTVATKPSSQALSWSSIAYGNGKFLSVSQAEFEGQQLGFTMISTDGTTWAESSANLPSGFTWIQKAAYGDGKFVTVASASTTAAYSTDGITWTQTTLPASTAWASVTYGGGKFVAVAYNSNTAAYSTDGITWTQSSLSSSENWYSVTYGSDKFVAVTAPGYHAAYSTDGVSWTASAIPAIERWLSVAHGENIVLNENNQYTVPSTKQAIISSIYVANNEATSQTYSVAVVPNGETLSNIHYIRKDISIDGNDFHTIDTKITLAEGDQIITEGTSTNVSVNIFGLEK